MGNNIVWNAGNGRFVTTFLAPGIDAESYSQHMISTEMVEGWTVEALNVEDLVIYEQPATPIVPQSITPRQGYIILSRYSLLASVKSYFDALEGQPGEEARIELEYAQEWRRDWPTLNAAATAFGLTSAQIDQMFIEAAAL